MKYVIDEEQITEICEQPSYGPQIVRSLKPIGTMTNEQAWDMWVSLRNNETPIIDFFRAIESAITGEQHEQ